MAGWTDLNPDVWVDKLILFADHFLRECIETPYLALRIPRGPAPPRLENVEPDGPAMIG